jgi:hypothetical protein
MGPRRTPADVALRLVGILAALLLCAGLAASAFEPDVPLLAQPIPAVLLPLGLLVLGAYGMGAGLLRGLVRREIQLTSGLLPRTSVKGAGAVFVGLAYGAFGLFWILVGASLLRGR